jgi:hypothetical protein
MSVLHCYHCYDLWGTAVNAVLGMESFFILSLRMTFDNAWVSGLHSAAVRITEQWRQTRKHFKWSCRLGDLFSCFLQSLQNATFVFHIMLDLISHSCDYVLFSGMAWCSLAESYRRSRAMLSACSLMVPCSAYSSTLKTEAVHISETSVNFYQTIPRHFPEGITVYTSV